MKWFGGSRHILWTQILTWVNSWKAQSYCLSEGSVTHTLDKSLVRHPDPPERLPSCVRAVSWLEGVGKSGGAGSRQGGVEPLGGVCPAGGPQGQASCRDPELPRGCPTLVPGSDGPCAADTGSSRLGFQLCHLLAWDPRTSPSL